MTARFGRNKRRAAREAQALLEQKLIDSQFEVKSLSNVEWNLRQKVGQLTKEIDKIARVLGPYSLAVKPREKWLSGSVLPDHPYRVPVPTPLRTGYLDPRVIQSEEMRTIDLTIFGVRFQIPEDNDIGLHVRLTSAIGDIGYAVTHENLAAWGDNDLVDHLSYEFALMMNAQLKKFRKTKR